MNYMLQPRHHKHEWMLTDVLKSKKFLNENPGYYNKSRQGNKTVIITADEYNQKMMELLEDD